MAATLAPASTVPLASTAPLARALAPASVPVPASVLTKALAALALGTGLALSAGATPALATPALAAPAPAASAAHCTRLPHASTEAGFVLANRQDGQVVCLSVGQRLLVLLRAPVGAVPWGPVHVSRPGTLRALPLTLMLARGVTGANFQAARAGVAELSSLRPACPPVAPGAARCDLVLAWRATVVVRAPSVAGGR